ncbi:cytochrome P450 [soil metagenome]
MQGIAFWNRPLAFLDRCRERFGGRFTLRLPATPPFVMFTDPDEIKEVFTAPPDVLHPGSGARVLEPIVGRNSVILLDGEGHLEQRKLMLPAFHGERMDRLSGLMAEVAERELDSWPKQEVEMHPLLQDLTLAIILSAVFGLERGPGMDALSDRLGMILAFGDRPLSLFAPDRESRIGRVLGRVGPYAEFARLQAEADEMIFALIEERRAAGDGEAGNDILALLLEARHEDGAPMSPEELRDELMTLLVAGHETTASSLAWLLALISRNPRVLGELRAEIAADGDDAYLTATIQEGLRCRPVLPTAAPRLVAKPIEVGGRRYPEGVCLVPNGYLVHHDPAIYPSPREFRPERFVEQPPGTYTWLPFGGGRRRCLGSGFAMTEMKIVLRCLLEARELSPADTSLEPARRRNITITPGRGARAKLPAYS